MNYVNSSFLLAASMAISPLFAGTMTDLGTLPGGDYFSTAYAVSNDGSVIVGISLVTSNDTHAFRWTGGGMTDLGTLGGTTSNAIAVSADGYIVAGTASRPNGYPSAFSWTSAGMIDLGTLGGQASHVSSISADGSVAVGYSDNANGQNRAFRWTSAGMADLGTLGTKESFATSVSADGSTVIGYTRFPINVSKPRAFRWTSAGMTDLGTFGGVETVAQGVSADGSVVVGYSEDVNGERRAFRWTSSGMIDLGISGVLSAAAQFVTSDGSVVVGVKTNLSGLQSAFRWTTGGVTQLGTLGGSFSDPKAISANADVIVGESSNANNQIHAFRWTSAGMVDLGTLGGNNSSATAVSADGSVVVGNATDINGNYHAFIYNDSVMLDVQDWLGSVGGVHSVLSTGLELSRTHLEGAHHRPLAELGRGRSFWTTGDVASSSRSRDLLTRSGEAGVTFAPLANVLVGIGAGYGLQDQGLLNGGSARTFGQYLVSEVDLIQADGGIFSLIVSVGDWKNETDRGYVTGGGVDFSHGETSLASKAVRLRYDSPVLARVYATDLKAYVSYTHSKVRSDAYAETGGSYAGSFGAMEQTAKEGRLGFAATHAFGEKTKLRLSAEWIRRFDRDQASITATDITSTLDLTLPGAPVVRDQARVGVDVDYALDAQTTLSFTVHAAGVGESADVSGAISLRRAF